MKYIYIYMLLRKRLDTGSEQTRRATGRVAVASGKFRSAAWSAEGQFDRRADTRVVDCDDVDFI